MKFLELNFIPRSQDFGLLLLRLTFGLTMLFLHGWVKIVNFEQYSAQFMNLFGLGQPVTLVLAIVGEFVAAILIIIGLWTRLGALLAAITMGVAFFVAHGAKLSGEGSGEMAYLYLAAFVVLFFTGAGRFSVDGKSGA